MVEALQFLSQQKLDLHITHQTGETDLEMVNMQYKKNHFPADVRPFIDDIEDQYRKASLVICRAGATTLAEVTACGKMSILVPFPHATHNHQVKNARILEAANAGEIVLDEELSGLRIAKSIIQAMEEPKRLKIMEENSYKLGNRDATEKVRLLCMELLEETYSKSGRTKKLQGNYVLSCF